MDGLTKTFMWVAGGLASCMVAHALMIPLGIESWLHNTFGAVGVSPDFTPGFTTGVDEVLDLSTP